MQKSYRIKTDIGTDKNIRLKLLAGLIDTDGSYSVKDKCYEITQKSNILTDDLLF